MGVWCGWDVMGETQNLRAMSFAETCGLRWKVTRERRDDLYYVNKLYSMHYVGCFFLKEYGLCTKNIYFYFYFIFMFIFISILFLFLFYFYLLFIYLFFPEISKPKQNKGGKKIPNNRYNIKKEICAYWVVTRCSAA
jgi:hypothetical protein